MTFLSGIAMPLAVNCTLRFVFAPYPNTLVLFTVNFEFLLGKTITLALALDALYTLFPANEYFTV